MAGDTLDFPRKDGLKVSPILIILIGVCLHAGMMIGAGAPELAQMSGWLRYGASFAIAALFEVLTVAVFTGVAALNRRAEAVRDRIAQRRAERVQDDT